MNGSKGTFITGLIVGAIVVAIGFFALSNTDLNKSDDLTADIVPDDIVDNNDPTAPGDGQPPIANIVVTKDDHVRGNFDAPITIVEYSDFQCPFCDRFHLTMLQVMDSYPDKVRWVYRHFPLGFHPFAQKAAEASECAADQGKFWEYADEPYKNQDSISEEYFSSLASQLGLDSGQFNSCLDSGKHTAKVTAQYQQGISEGVQGTPGGFINGQVLGGAVPFETIQAIIESL